MLDTAQILITFHLTWMYRARDRVYSHFLRNLCNPSDLATTPNVGANEQEIVPSMAIDEFNICSIRKMSIFNICLIGKKYLFVYCTASVSTATIFFPAYLFVMAAQTFLLKSSVYALNHCSQTQPVYDILSYFSAQNVKFCYCTWGH